jgi:hypothetical protein
LYKLKSFCDISIMCWSCLPFLLSSLIIFNYIFWFSFFFQQFWIYVVHYIFLLKTDNFPCHFYNLFTSLIFLSHSSALCSILFVVLSLCLFISIFISYLVCFSYSPYLSYFYDSRKDIWATHIHVYSNYCFNRKNCGKKQDMYKEMFLGLKNTHHQYFKSLKIPRFKILRE